MLENKIALVTGGSAGMGKAIVLKYLQEGAVVIATARRQEKLDQLMEMTDKKDHLFLVKSDVGKKEDVKALLQFVQERFGHLDILVNNAGVMDGMEPVADVSDEVWQKLLNINLTGPFMLCRGAVKMMLAQENKGIIINIASGGGIGGGRAGAAYTASKFGLVGLSRNIAYMYGPDGIRCNVICPGGVATEIKMENINEYGWQRVGKGTQAIRMGKPEEIADLALYLASPYATLLNGAVITADAGRSAW